MNKYKIKYSNLGEISQDKHLESSLRENKEFIYKRMRIILEDFSWATPDSKKKIKRQSHLSIEEKWTLYSTKSAGKYKVHHFHTGKDKEN